VKATRSDFDAIVIGGGAAGLMCAAVAGQGGARVAVLDHSESVAEKIRISGGGRCNFTNRDVGVAHMVSENPRFARYALTEYPSVRFIDLVRQYRIAFHEKHKGQLFCDNSAQDIIDMLLAECAKGRVQHMRPVTVGDVQPDAQGQWRVQVSGVGELKAKHVVVASGGLSIPKIGATDWGYRLARNLNIPVVETRPALVPLMFDPTQWQPFAALSGLALPVRVRAPAEKGAPLFDEDLLFTHRGLSGPAILQISSFWQPGQDIELDLASGCDWEAALLEGKSGGRHLLRNAVLENMPKRLWDTWLEQADWQAAAGQRHADLADRVLRGLAVSLRQWRIKPMGSEGYRKAEVTRGGVSTRALDAVSLQSKAHAGLHFIGEVVDITGWLGGYNFQWAWASGHAAGRAIAAGLGG
jgi:predicted Rossmann fold flavoprotein